MITMRNVEKGVQEVPGPYLFRRPGIIVGIVLAVVLFSPTKSKNFPTQYQSFSKKDS